MKQVRNCPRYSIEETRFQPGLTIYVVKVEHPTEETRRVEVWHNTYYGAIQVKSNNPDAPTIAAFIAEHIAEMRRDAGVWD